MGREIRRVPVDWQHPTELKAYYRDNTPQEHYKPLHDHTFEEAVREWYDDLQDWLADKDGKRSKLAAQSPEFYGGDPVVGYFHYAGNGPDEEVCRPAFTSEPTAYQVYETVSEGTPVGPVCATREDLIAWLTTDHPEGWPGQPDGDRHTDTRGGYWWHAVSREGAERFIELESVPSGISTAEHGYESGIEAVSNGRF